MVPPDQHLLRFGLKMTYFLKTSIITLNRCQWRDSFALKSMLEIYINTFRNYIDRGGRAKHLRGWWAEAPLALWYETSLVGRCVGVGGATSPTILSSDPPMQGNCKRCLGPPAAKMLRPTSRIDVVSKSVDVYLPHTF